MQNTKRNKQNKVNSKTKSRNESKGSKFSNDPSWYSVDPVLLRDSASIPYSVPAGMELPLAAGVSSGRARIPGVIAYKLAPTIGYSNEATDAVNIAATQSYAFIRHANSGSANYDAPDIMLYYLAMADVYSYIEYLKRMYGVVQVYAQRNKYLPYTLLAAMGVEPQSLIDNLANFRLGVNMLINKAASFAVPNTMSLFARRQFLYAGVYTEGTSIRDQLYLFTPHGFHTWDWLNNQTNYFEFTTASILATLDITVEPVGAGRWHAMDLVKIGHSMVDKIINSEDMGIMNGDILKAYGDNILKLSHLTEDYAIAPVYDPYVLEQMQNASIIPVESSSTFDIVSSYTNEEDGLDGGYLGMPVLKSNPTVQGLLKAVMRNSSTKLLTNIEHNIKHLFIPGNTQGHIVSTLITEPSPADNMEITRLTAFIDSENHIHCGTEVCVGCTVYKHPYNGTNSGVGENVLQHVLNTFDDTDWTVPDDYKGDKYQVGNCVQASLSSLIATSPFKFRPHVYLYDPCMTLLTWLDAEKIYNREYLYTAAQSVSGNFSNYTVLNNETLDKMHRAAIMNEFATPHVAIKSV